MREQRFKVNDLYKDIEFDGIDVSKEILHNLSMMYSREIAKPQPQPVFTTDYIFNNGHMKHNRYLYEEYLDAVELKNIIKENAAITDIREVIIEIVNETKFKELESIYIINNRNKTINYILDDNIES